MAWIPPAIDWLCLRTDQEFEKAIRTLMRTNPVVTGSVFRPTRYRNLYQAVNAFAQKELAGILRNAAAYAGSQEIQKQLMDQITNELIVDHCLYKRTVSGPQPANCIIYRRQIWWPASFYIVKGRTIFDWDNAQRDFYETRPARQRHPAIVTGVVNAGLYWMVPCSHSRGGGAVKVVLKPGDESYAKCGFSFKASWSMLCADPNAIDRGGLRVTTVDFVKIGQKIREILTQRQMLQE